MHLKNLKFDHYSFLVFYGKVKFTVVENLGLVTFIEQHIIDTNAGKQLS
jgi:hypothetical protein